MYFVFLGPHLWHMEIPRLGNQSCSCWPTPQPQQCQIPAASVTCGVGHNNTILNPLTEARD